MRTSHQWIAEAVDFSMFAALSLITSCALHVLQLWLDARFQISFGSISVQRSVSLVPTVIGMAYGAYKIIKPRGQPRGGPHVIESPPPFDKQPERALRGRVTHEEVVLAPKNFILTEI